MSVIGKATNDRQITALSYFKVVRVVSRGNLYNACSFFHIGVFITNDRQFFVEQRQNNVTAVQMLISIVVFVYGNGGIAKHSFGARRSNFKKFACFLNLIEQVPKMSVLFFVFNLGVGN